MPPLHHPPVREVVMTVEYLWGRRALASLFTLTLLVGFNAPGYVTVGAFIIGVIGMAQKKEKELKK
jgi:hypothetical protein